MERRHFLKIAVGAAAGATALAASAQAAALLPHPLAEDERLPANEAARPAVTSKDEVESLKPEEVHWGHHWHRHWHRHWGWRHRHWGWHHRRWHHRHWHRRYW